MTWTIKLDYYYRVRLKCVLRTHIKLFIFENIFSEIKIAVITFLILEIFFSKIEINVRPKDTH